MDTLDELLPREKMLRSGIASLSDVELLALFLRTGTPGKDVMTLAKEILQHFGHCMACCRRTLRSFAA